MEPVRLPSAGETLAARAEMLGYPLTEACTSPYVRLLSAVPPGATSFPEMEEVVRKTVPLDGVELVTEACRHATCLGAKVPTVAAAMALRGAVNARDGGGGAEALCHVPRAVRTIALTVRP